MLDRLRFINIVRFLVTLFLFFLLFTFVDLSIFFSIAQNANILLLIFLISFFLILIILKSLKWNIILRGYGIKESLKITSIFYWIGSFFNNFLPSSVGGDSYKFIALNKRWPNQKAAIGSSLVLERLIGIFTMIPFPIMIGWLFLGQNQRFDLLYWGYSIGFFVIILVMVAGWFAARHYGNDMLTKARSSIVRKIFFIIDVFFSYRDQTGLSLAVLISIVLFVLSCLFYLLCFRAFGEQIGFMHLIFILPIISVAGAVPISINGLGVKEGLSVFLFSMFGISLEVALAVALTARVLLIIATSTGGIAYLFVRPATISGNHS